MAAATGVLALLLVAILLDDGPRPAPEPVEVTAAAEPSSVAPTPSPAPVASPAVAACAYVPAGVPARPVAPPPPVPGPEPALAVVLRTSVGDIDLVLDAEQAPCAVHSLRHLAVSGFYTDTPCHRLVAAGIFVLQCGDPTATGNGGPGYRFAEEALEDAAYERGTVAMVNSGPGTTGSQFFLVYDDSPLPAQYTPVGTVGDAGLAVLDRVAAAGTGPLSPSGATPPVLPVQIVDVRVTPLPALPEPAAG